MYGKNSNESIDEIVSTFISTKTNFINYHIINKSTCYKFGIVYLKVLISIFTSPLTCFFFKFINISFV